MGDVVDFREAFISFLQAERISQASIAENYPRQMSPQSLNAILKPKEDCADELSVSAKSDLLDALVSLDKQKGGGVFYALTKGESEAAQILFDYARVHYSLIDGTLLFSRSEMDSLIERDVKKASHELTIIGSVSNKKLTKAWYSQIAQHLIKNNSLVVTLFVESNQSLYWRAMSLDADVDFEVRPQMDLVMRNDKLIRELEKQVVSHANDMNGHTENITDRLRIYEVDFPITANVIKIDDKLYVTPRTHLRASKSTTLLLCSSYPNLLWTQYKDYVNFFSKLSKEKKGKFVGPREPEDQKILLYSSDGLIPRGVGRRSILDSEPKLETRVVHGLVFSREGEFLLRYRGEKVNRDNQNRWDKSCGSNMRPTDLSNRHSIKRTIRKELFETMALDISDELHKSVYEEERILDLGEWRGAKGLNQCSDEQEWYFFELLEPRGGLWPFPGPRYHDETQIVLDHPSIFASVFIIVCNKDFLHYTKELIKNNPKNEVCRWIMPDRNKKANHLQLKKTNDLETYLYEGESNNSLFTRICQVSLAIRTKL